MSIAQHLILESFRLAVVSGNPHKMFEADDIIWNF